MIEGLLAGCAREPCRGKEEGGCGSREGGGGGGGWPGLVCWCCCCCG